MGETKLRLLLILLWLWQHYYRPEHDGDQQYEIKYEGVHPRLEHEKGKQTLKTGNMTTIYLTLTNKGDWNVMVGDTKGSM